MALCETACFAGLILACLLYTSKHGYGYFFWTNPDDESYRADGMYGQYIVVVPKSKAVVTVQALDSKKFFDDVWSELVVPFLNKG